MALIVMFLVIVSPGFMLNPPTVSPHSDSLFAKEQRIDITIQDSEFLFSHPVAPQLGRPTVIILRNQDIVQHGFTSSILKGVQVRAQGEGMAAYGKGLEGFYVNPGKTLVLRLTIDQPGRHSFRCDLHPTMKGEVLVLEMTTA
jgi:hypothetical protein